MSDITTVKQAATAIEEMREEIKALKEAAVPTPNERFEILWNIVKAKMTSDFPRDEPASD